MLEITTGQRRSLRSRAYPLKPVAAIGQNGLTEPVVKEIGVCLDSHELVKIRVYNDDREERERLMDEICERLGAAPVQHIGKLLVVWRPAPDGAAAKARSRPRRKAVLRRSKRSFQMEHG
ncbi:MAG: YhbY family RNA-binding protein [Candidatus Accumulibacter sp.]|jgi:putative YhbY family RNA-binding protein|nr:YhbY family RNA-binding protein [Accumulibacter sp.]